ncbi:hypothetical protein ASG43_09930 [Aureimonas sp. Leaf454]|uniref:gluconate 2-dehydrogenase subunit 3 family protein n=1 Tax=Aureimonas sp. Leaf454 TaxID=1736381 RepID=UPI00070110A2|nr:gluconate 2-dehydrogenase subunit 3 family protein [Aureimonas sp. Leaf454]KQT47429.1 hypothetical protein ASG43_09930 [Aureimonas sp. Leaf454]
MKDDRPSEASATRPTEAPPAIPSAYEALIRSSRVSPHLRAALLERAEPLDPATRPRSLDARHLDVLRAALDSVIPQGPGASIDLAARLDTMMAEATGNGWRYEALPSDPDAYRVGLETLDDLALEREGRGLADLPRPARDALLQAIADGAAGMDGRSDRFTAAQMVLWFEELRSDAVRHYVAHPATMARIGYSGIANGGAGGAAFTGFSAVGIGRREDWEPRALVEGAAS